MAHGVGEDIKSHTLLHNAREYVDIDGNIIILYTWVRISFHMIDKIYHRDIKYKFISSNIPA